MYLINVKFFIEENANLFMKKALIDTNFIMTCVKQKINFIEELNFAGIKPLIPVEVLKELKNNHADLALAILKSEKDNFEEIEIGAGHVDKRIIEFAKKNPRIIIATLDLEIKKAIINNKAVINEKKRIGII
jgi:rRNA-processing protein FCF1